MKKLPLSSLIAPFEKVLRVEYSPIITKEKKFRHEEYILALVLQWVKPFIEEIEDARAAIGIKKCLEYPTNPTIESLSDFFTSMSLEELEILREAVRRITQRFYLPEQWNLSVQTAILYNVLLIPQKTGLGIHFYYPEISNNKSLSALQQVKLFIKERSRDQYPAIYFTERVGSEEFIEWIRHNKQIFDIFLHNLPADRGIKNKIHTFLWGQIAWLLVQNDKQAVSWVKVCDDIDNILSDDKDRHPERYTQLPKKFKEAPSEQEVLLEYNRFCKLIEDVPKNPSLMRYSNKQ